MLGRKITDLSGAEAIGEYTGMGLIPIETVFDKEKKAAKTSGVINNVEGKLNGLSGQPFNGYEIHMGKTENGQIIVKGNKNVYGTYIHGIFDSKDVTDSILKAIKNEKGIADNGIKAIDMTEYKNCQYDILADYVRKNIDMEVVYNILEKGVDK